MECEQYDSLRALIDEQDRRYQQRFEAQQTALKDALQAAEKAVGAALTAADRAVAKAEMAAEKRFESVNEFRATLSDQAAQFMPRMEANAKIDGLAEKINAIRNLCMGTVLMCTAVVTVILLILKH